MIDLDDVDLHSPDVENQMLEHFGDQFLADAMRIVQSRSFSALDNEVIYEAMCIVVATYIRKAKTGEINKNRILH